MSAVSILDAGNVTNGTSPTSAQEWANTQAMINALTIANSTSDRNVLIPEGFTISM